MNKDFLKPDKENTTKPASAINPEPTIPPDTIDSLHESLNTYFKNHPDPRISLAYSKGEIFSLKDDFDFFRFLKSIINIFEESMVANDLTDIESQQVKYTINTIHSCVDILKTINIDSAESNILPILINYCTSSFSKYNKSYVKSREV